jgi:hypothetical protein
LLAVAREFGFDRIGEMPIRLDYRFTGSGVRSRAVLRALIDTTAIFYRLRVMRYYQRRRRLAGAYGWTRPRDYRPLVSVLILPGGYFRESDYRNVEVIDVGSDRSEELRRAVERARGEVVAILEPGGRSAANWLAATVPFLRRGEIVGVVVPKIAPLDGLVRARAAAAVDESRIGAGLGYFRSTPGNVRYVDEFPTSSIVMRRRSFMELQGSVSLGLLVATLAERGRVLYTPESVVVATPPRLFAPHLNAVWQRGRVRAEFVKGGAGNWRLAPFILPALLVLAAALLALVLDGPWANLPFAIVAVYLLAVVTASVGAMFRYKSLRVGALTSIGIVFTHCAYVAGFVVRLTGF